MVERDIQILEDMLTALVDLLVERGVITQQEYETKVKSLLEESAGLTRFEDLEK